MIRQNCAQQASNTPASDGPNLGRHPWLDPGPTPSRKREGVGVGLPPRHFKAALSQNHMLPAPPDDAKERPRAGATKSCFWFGGLRSKGEAIGS